MTTVWIGAISVLLTFSIFLATVIWKSGHVAGRLGTRVDGVEITVTRAATMVGELSGIVASLVVRVSELEKWRGNVRNDLHEISDQLGRLIADVQSLRTLIEERTERRLDRAHEAGEDLHRRLERAQARRAHDQKPDDGS